MKEPLYKDNEDLNEAGETLLCEFEALVRPFIKEKAALHTRAELYCVLNSTIWFLITVIHGAVRRERVRDSKQTNG